MSQSLLTAPVSLRSRSFCSHVVRHSSNAPARRSLTIRAEDKRVNSEGVVQFRPCIDIHKGRVKQIVGSTLTDTPNGEQGGGADVITNFETDKSAGEFARLYSEDELTGGHVIMLGANEASHRAAVDALTAYPGGLQVGGGMTPESSVQYLDAGASHIIVTSYVFSNGQFNEDRLKKMVNTVGRKRLVLDLSCRKGADGEYKVVTDRWQNFTDFSVNPENLDMLAESADELLVHGVDVEGMKLGIDEELVELLGKYSPLPVTYAGGVRGLDDLERVRIAGRGNVDITVGSALDIFGGSLPYADVVAWHRAQAQKAV